MTKKIDFGFTARDYGLSYNPSLSADATNVFGEKGLAWIVFEDSEAKPFIANFYRIDEDDNFDIGGEYDIPDSSFSKLSEAVAFLAARIGTVPSEIFSSEAYKAFRDHVVTKIIGFE